MAASVTLTCDQNSDFIFVLTYAQAVPASTWAAATDYVAGAVVLPTTSTGFVYTASSGGLSGATEPTWPVALGATVQDGTVTWTCTGPSVLPVDLTGYTAFSSISASLGGTPIATISTTPSASGVITLGGTAGTISVDWKPVVTNQLSGVAFTDVFLVSPAGQTSNIASIKVKVNAAITVPPTV